MAGLHHSTCKLCKTKKESKEATGSCFLSHLEVTAAAVGGISVQVVVVRHFLAMVLHSCGNAALQFASVMTASQDAHSKQQQPPLSAHCTLALPLRLPVTAVFQHDNLWQSRALENTKMSGPEMLGAAAAKDYAARCIAPRAAVLLSPV